MLWGIKIETYTYSEVIIQNTHSSIRLRANCSTDTGLSRLKDMTLNETENLKHTCMI